MKKDLHPDYQLAKVKCATCGEEFEIGSTLESINVDTCSNCHPFYTGKQTFTSAQGRVERFNRRYNINRKNEEAVEESEEVETKE